MTLRFRFISNVTNTVIADTPVVSASIRWQLNQASEWTAELPKNLLAVQGVDKGNYVEIYRGTQFLLSGTLQTIDERWNSDKLTLSLSGRGRMDDLYDVRAYSQAYYEDKELLLVFGLLLDRAGWRIGNIETLADKTEKTTVDLRSEKRLLPQITSLVKGIPGVLLRYGGLINGKHSLDIGLFNSIADLQLLQIPRGDFVQVDNKVGFIQDISIRTTLTEIINSVEVIGGDVKDNTGLSRTILLKDALTAQPGLATDPNFPIQTAISNYVYLIRNNAVPLTSGAQSSERYTQYAPPKETGNATLAACNAAGLALYKRGVAFLKDHASNRKEISINAVGENIYAEVGNSIYVHAHAENPIIDPYTDRIVDRISSDINGYYRLTGINLSLSGDKETWAYTLSDTPYVENQDLFVSVYDETKRDQPPAGIVFAPAFAPALNAITTTQSGGASNTTLSDGTPAIYVTIPLPATPGGATAVMLAGTPYGTSANGTVIIEQDTDPIFASSTGPRVKLAIKYSGWNSAFSATLNGYVIWT